MGNWNDVVFCSQSPLAVEAGRHPVLEELPSVDFVANSTYLSPSFNTSIGEFLLIFAWAIRMTACFVYSDRPERRW